MSLLTSRAVFLLGTALALQLVYSIFRRVRQATRARQLDCKSIPALPQPWFDLLGVKLVSYFDLHAKDNTLVEAFHHLFKISSHDEGRKVRTLKYHALGTKIFTYDPKNIQAILATQFEDFEIGSQRIANFMPFLGPGIFNANGPQWSHSRAMLRPCFTRDQINDLDTQTKHIEALMQRLPTDEKGWTETVDLQNLFFSFTIDHATEFLFGESAQVQTGTGPLDGKAFVEAYEHCTDTSADRFRYGAMYWLHNPTSYREACDKVHQFVDYYVNLALESSDTTNARQTRSEKGCKEKYVFLDELVQQTRDPLKLRAELLNILLAGRDTTSALLGFLFALLARHPHHFARLSEAVLLAFGSEDQPKGEINFTTLKACSMLQYTLSEALRLYPVVPINGPRVARKDTTLPRGGGEDGLSPVFVPKGTQVDYMVYSTHRDSDFWGDDVEMFKPERWRARKSGFEFLPFNAGPRVCIGQQFALTTAGFVTVKLLQRFDKIENMQSQPIKMAISITASVYEGTPVRLHRA